MAVAQERTDLLRELGLDKQNHAALGRVLGTRSIARATERADGTMEATIRIKEDELAWEPAILVMPHGGFIELTVINDDKNTHAALFPSNGDRKFLWLLNHSKGRAKPASRRPRLLLVQLARRQRRRPWIDRRHRRARRGAAGGPSRPSRSAASIGRNQDDHRIRGRRRGDRPVSAERDCRHRPGGDNQRRLPAAP